MQSERGGNMVTGERKERAREIGAGLTASSRRGQKKISLLAYEKRTFAGANEVLRRGERAAV